MSHKYTVKVDDDGDVIYYKDGKRHRDGDLPAVILGDGTVIYARDGNLHRDGDKPAYVSTTGYASYWKNGYDYPPPVKK